MYKFLATLLSVLMVTSVMAQSEVPSVKKKRSSFIQIDKDLSKIFGEKKEKKPKKKQKEVKEVVVAKPKPISAPAPTPAPVAPLKPKIEIQPVNDNLSVSSMPKFYKKRL